MTNKNCHKNRGAAEENQHHQAGVSNQPFTAAGTPARRMEWKAAVVPQQHAHRNEERNEKQQPILKNQSPQGRTPTTGLVRGSFRETQAALCSHTLWGVENHYSLELVECLLCDFGVNTKGLRLERCF